MSLRRAAPELVCTVALPVAILTFGTEALGPTGAVLASLVPPVGFVVWRMAVDRAVSAMGVISLVGLGLSGGISLLALPPSLFALKEALLPMLLGAAFAATGGSHWSPLRTTLELVLDPVRLAERRVGREEAFRQALRRSTVELGLAMAAVGAWSGVLAWWLVSSPPGTERFATELARYTMWQFPMVTLPMVMVSGVVLRRALALLEDALGVPWDTLLLADDPPAEA